jgi:hypothetical protein
MTPEELIPNVQTDPPAPGPRVLVVGPFAGLDDLPAACRRAESIVALPWARLSAAVVAEIAPGLVIAPLMADGFDFLDIGARLRAANYAGPVHVLAPPLPDPAAVLRELGCQFPGLDLTILPAVAGVSG